MVANLREAALATPSARMLAIIGSAHKGLYERYLGQMADIPIIDIGGILR
jgi:hypothetical protein